MHSIKLLWSLLQPHQRRKFLILLALTTLSGFVEILSVGLVIPFIAVASGSLPFGNANVITRTLTDMLHSLGVPAQHTTAALGLIFLLGVGLANTYLCAYQLYTARVVTTLKSDFSIRIIKTLAQRPLDWLDLENSSDLTKVALNDVGQVCFVIMAATQVAAIITRSFVVYLFFLATQARLAIALAISLGLLYQFIMRFIQRPIARAGSSAQLAQSQMFRAASELIGGARAVRSTSTEHRFFSRFAEASERSIEPQVVRSMPGTITRAALETAIVAVVIGLLVYFNSKDGNLANGLPLLSSYAVAGIRLLPALQQCLVSVVEIRYFGPSVGEVARLLRLESDGDEMTAEDAKPLPFQTALSLKQIRYFYTKESWVLNGINLTIKKNSRVAFVGETGAGKSTIVDIILALRQAQEGGLWVDEVPITTENAKNWRRSVGYVPQSIYLLDATIAENVAFGQLPDEVDPVRLREACDAASLTSFIESLPQAHGTFVGERGVRLSGGQCQRIGIARALYHNPSVVIFDEATSALDTVTESSVLESLDRLKGAKTLIVIAHRLNTVWDFDTIFVLEKGLLVGQGTSQELLQNCPTFEKLARHQMHLSYSTPLGKESGLTVNGQTRIPDTDRVEGDLAKSKGHA